MAIKNTFKMYTLTSVFNYIYSTENITIELSNLFLDINKKDIITSIYGNKPLI